MKHLLSLKKSVVICFVLFAILEGASSVGLSVFEGYAIDLISGQNPQGLLIETVVLGMVAFLILQWLTSACVPYFYKTRWTQAFFSLRSHVMSAVLAASAAPSGANSGGDMASRLSVDLKQLESFYQNDCYIALRRLAIAFLALFLSFAINWRLAIVEFALLPLVLWLNRKINSSWEEIYYQIDEQFGKMSDMFTSSIRAFQLIKSYGAEDFFLSKFRSIAQDITAKTVRNNASITATSSLLILVNLLPTILHFSLGTVLIIKGQFSFGQFILFGSFRGYVSNFLMFLPKFIPSHHKAKAAARRLDDIFDLPCAENYVTPEPLPEAISLAARSLSFSYSQRQILCGITAEFSMDAIHGIIGKSGAGKSTLLNLLAGFLPPTGGTVCVNAQLLSSDYSHAITYVGQQPFLFPDTVENNLRTDQTVATQKAMMEICKRLEIFDAIMQLPDGFQTKIGSGSAASLSVGQLQRLCVARAFLSKKPLIFLDEPTAALDPQSEALVLSLLQAEKQGRAIILVTHSQAAMQICDHLLEIRENGTLEKTKQPVEAIS